MPQPNSDHILLKQKPKFPEHPRQRIGVLRAVLFFIDPNLRFTFTSPGIEHHTGLTPKQMKGRSLMDFVHPDDARSFQDRFIQTTYHGLRTLKIRIGAPGKGFRWVKACVMPLFHRSKPSGTQGILIDIHKDKPHHALPVTGENKYLEIIENLLDGVFESDLQGRITYCNKALANLAGYQQSELVGKNFREITPLRAFRTIRVRLGRMYQNGQRTGIVNSRIRHKSGRTLTIECSISLIVSPQGDPIGVQGTLRDVSKQVNALEKQKQLQAQLNHARKMNALETLAGGLAHGFNNVLMAIQGNLSLIRMGLPQQHPVQKNIERINQSVEKGNHLAREILSFAKVGKFVVMPTNMDNIIKSTCRLFARSHPNLIIHERLSGKLRQTHVDRVQIGQVLLSLYKNAADAMPDGGDIYLKSKNITLDESDTHPFGAKPGPYVKISVTDSGMGLGNEAKERVFEPFYSAYRTARYDGMGLAAAYSTIRSHQGIINVDSKKGEGTTFTLYLPAEPVNASTQLRSMGNAAGIETILLVDDDKACTKVCCKMLERLGYRVITAGTGHAAIEIYAKHKDHIHLVLLDVVLPDTDGDHVFQKIKQCNPNATVVVISGYNVNRQVGGLLNQGCFGFIQKPFGRKVLANKVRAALDRTAVPPAIDQIIT